MFEEKKWTLKSIAEKLGVSNATVSNAFNRPDQLSEKRRKDILAACAELGYSGPNKAAQSLRKGKFDTVALVLSDSVEYMVSDPVASHFMKGVASVLAREKINLLLFSGSAEHVNSVVDFVDGFICYGRPRNPLLVEQLKQVRKKVVTVDFDIQRNASVGIDNQSAAHEIAQLAIQSSDDDVAIMGLRLLDHNAICYVEDLDSVVTEASVAHQRLKGYLSALSFKDVTLKKQRVWNIPESRSECASIAAKQALNATPRANVFLCMSDIIALTLMNEATKMGLKIPSDIRVVGFDGIDEGVRCNPPLATVHQFSEQKGIKAAQMFVDGANHEETLPYGIREGGSC
ncbi:LacI family DNA-binding transcriptional regulator [Shewanella surugensis]|uniref:LacI family DNA-binding transcriptional regulator n=1 Tax=Shewanella surugensis TaxID=212020 RepID=A0ABT0L8P8_9GAMM|nr:LacI family DNA-binding transcriptional regulator [Shewanella surugensis]MCL1124033.1 LacI family DNA-binding transcriptional regulator [Shewanella surugensis]